MEAMADSNSINNNNNNNRPTLLIPSNNNNIMLNSNRNNNSSSNWLSSFRPLPSTTDASVTSMTPPTGAERDTTGQTPSDLVQTSGTEAEAEEGGEALGTVE